MIYLIHGPDRLLARDAATTVALGVDPEGTNTSWIEGRETTHEQLVSAIGTASFFGSPRVVIVSNYFSRAKSNNGPESNATEASAETLVSRPGQNLKLVLAAVPEENCLIFFEPDLTAAPAAFKSFGKTSSVIAGEPPRGPALIAWIENAAQRAQSRFDRRAAQQLAETLFPQTWDRKPANPRYDRPPDMSLLTQEIEKLALAAYPDAIGVDHIRQLVASGPDQRVFRFLDAALAGDVRTATNELDRLLAAGEEPAMLLAQLLGQIELIALACAAGGRDAATVARDVGTITPARASALLATSRRFSRGPDSVIAKGVATDRKLKTGRIRQPIAALHDIVIALASSPSQPAGRAR